MGIDGDDAVELINGFAIRFDVSLDGFDFKKNFATEAVGGAIAFFIELFKKEKSRNLRRLEIVDLVRCIGGKIF